MHTSINRINQFEASCGVMEGGKFSQVFGEFSSFELDHDAFELGTRDNVAIEAASKQP